MALTRNFSLICAVWSLIEWDLEADFLRPSIAGLLGHIPKWIFFKPETIDWDLVANFAKITIENLSKLLN